MGVSHFQRHSRQVTKTRRWQRVRSLVLRRDGFRCVNCGTAGRLEVDHIKPVRTDPDLAFDLSNLQSLCSTCHTRKTRVELGQKTEPMSVEQIHNRRKWRLFVSDMETPALRKRHA